MNATSAFKQCMLSALFFYFFSLFFSDARAQIVSLIADNSKGFVYPTGLTVDGIGNLYAADWSEHVIFKIDLSNNSVTQLPLDKAELNGVANLAYDGSRYLYTTISNSNTVKRIDLTDNSITVISGNGTAGSADGQGTGAQHYYPYGIALDAANGNLYISDQHTHVIRKIELNNNNTVTTIAGQANTSGNADGQGSQARFNLPTSLALDGNGNLYVADAQNNTIRKIELNNNNTVTTVAGLAETTGSMDGNGSQARFYYPTGLALFGNNILFVADFYNGRIRRIDLNNNNAVTTVEGDNGNLDNAAESITLDGAGNLYLSDIFNSEIRKMALSSTLPVTFGSISASFNGSELNINWQTLSETNNDHFEVQVSEDGKNFTIVNTLASKAPNGNSDSLLEYNLSFSLGASAALSGLGVLSLLALAVPGKRRKWMSIAASFVIGVAVWSSCTKTGTAAISGMKKAYVRIAQVDKDGTKSYSKIIVINNSR
ncbi:NHL repeat-containing protein [Niabella aquatica]